MAAEALKARRRSDYNFSLEYRTRWSDNDMYHHLNNSVYYYLFDSVVNTYLIKHCSLHPPTSDQIGLVVHSHCDYFAPVEFPAVVDLALRVNKLGKSSVTYEIGVFERGQDDVKAVGEFIHVFVDRDNRRPAKTGMANDLKRGLQQLMADNPKL
ncbi:Thioesterase/thiol ester dehydrase-isomerase [Ophiobolus disseminans]|uniref:Thioesterase/thiol ester dehydrase-isomerase n=1 Tax=Ophiobolus disseminans TaxID=1469910 RepID=A0A6A6ZZ93_9PLEO|nr:Thioesterase/thiol ester dehydrase-isomerase [Ophiobolus disseminans]